VVDSGRILTGAASDEADIVEAAEDVETFRMGEKDDIAEPGLGGKVCFANTAFFWAIIVSLKEGFGGPVVLLENPRPGRAAAASVFLGEFGLSGDMSSNLCWVVSSVAIILKLLACLFMRGYCTYASPFAGHISVKVQ
jgi:hypothetical protein